MMLRLQYRQAKSPTETQRAFGYAAITDNDRDLIFGKNAAKIYDIDVDAIRKAVPGDQLTKMKLAYQESGAEPSNTSYGWVLA